MILNPSCVVCGAHSALVEVLSPGELPRGFDAWSDSERAVYDQFEDLATWRFRYDGPGGGNGYGATIQRDRAVALVEVFTPPIQIHRLDELDLHDHAGICRECGAAYCPRHWKISETGYGRCPQGHGKSLDPHWHP